MSQAIFTSGIQNFTKTWPGAASVKDIVFPDNASIREKIPIYSKINSVSLSCKAELIKEGLTELGGIGISIRRAYGTKDSDGNNTTSYDYTSEINIIPKESPLNFSRVYTETLSKANFSSDQENAGVFQKGNGYNGSSDLGSTKSFDLRVSAILDKEKTVSISDINLTYDFTGPTLLINAGSGGSVENSGTHTIEKNSEITCTPIPVDGYRFARWSDGKTDNPRIFSEEDVGGVTTTYTAEFEPYWKIIYNNVDNSLISNLPKGYLTQDGALGEDLNPNGIESFSLPNNLECLGYTFLGWSGTNINGISKDVIVQLKGESQNKEFTANWQIIEYSINYNYNGGYPVGAEILKYTIEDTINLSIPEKTGYSFIGWTGTGLNNPTLNVVLTNSVGDKEFVANWEINQYKITVSSFPEGSGNIEMVIGKNTYTNNNFPIYQDYGTVITQVVANASNTIQYVFSHFEVINETNNININTFYNNVITNWTLNNYNTNFKACFNLRNYPINVSSRLVEEDEFGNLTEINEDCAIFMLNNSFIFSDQAYGSTVNISFAPKQGYKFVKWKNIGPSKAEKSILDYTVTENNNIIAYFEKINENQDSIPEDIEDKTEDEKNIILTSLTDSIINKTVEKYINTKPIKKISDYVFYKCENLKFVNISDVQETTLGEKAFSGCKALTFIKLPEKISAIDSEAFSDCSNLTTIIIPNKNSIVQLIDGTIFSGTPYYNGYGYIYVPKDIIDQYKSDAETNWRFIDSEQFLAIEDYPEICEGVIEEND